MLSGLNNYSLKFSRFSSVSAGASESPGLLDKVRLKQPLTTDAFIPFTTETFFFSTNALRSQLAQYLTGIQKDFKQNSSDLKQLLLDFSLLSGTSSGPDAASKAALIIRPVKTNVPFITAKKVKTVPRSKSKTQIAAKNAKRQQTEQITLNVRQVFFKNFLHTDAIPKTMRLELPPLEKKNGIVLPNVMLTAGNEFIAQPQFDQKGVSLVTNRFWKAVFKSIKALSEKGNFNNWVSVSNNGSTTLFKRFSFNWVEHYVDMNGQRLKPFALEKLPDGRIVDVKNFETSKSTLLPKATQKAVANQLETLIRENFDAKHFVLEDSKKIKNNARHHAEIITSKPVLSVTLPNLHAKNPFIKAEEAPQDA